MAGMPKNRTANGKNARRQSKRKRQRAALKQARDMCLVTGDVVENIDPAHAMNWILDRTFHMLRNAEEGVAKLEPDEVWRDTMVGTIPNEWIRLEEDLRKECAAIASKMIALDLDRRRVKTGEILAAVIAPVIQTMLDQLELTSDQKKAAPQIVQDSLKLLETGHNGKEREPATVGA